MTHFTGKTPEDFEAYAKKIDKWANTAFEEAHAALLKGDEFTTRRHMESYRALTASAEKYREIARGMRAS